MVERQRHLGFIQELRQQMLRHHPLLVSADLVRRSLPKTTLRLSQGGVLDP